MSISIGGFFELENLGPKEKAYHRGALFLNTGRAALRHVLSKLKPSHVHLPFYTCDAVIEAVSANNLAFSFYPLTDQLSPEFAPTLPANEYIVYINYFGLKGSTVRHLTQTYGRNLIVDNVQAFFAQPLGVHISFNSARKFFGVPDGAYLYSPFGTTEYERNEDIRTAHLELRKNGRLEEGFREYRAYEEKITTRVMMGSQVSEDMLARIDYDAVAHRRKQNFAFCHQHFLAVNEFGIDVDAMESEDQVPFCYPLWLKRPLDRKQLHKEGIFVPHLWPEVAKRPGNGEFRLERQMATELLPLPVDHRYRESEMARMIQKVKDLFKI